MATDRNGNPLAVGNEVRILCRPVRVLQVEPIEWSKDEQTETLFIYPDYDSEAEADAAREYLTGVVRAVEDATVVVKVQGIEAPKPFAANRIEVTA